jgi:hypothetical protein
VFLWFRSGFLWFRCGFLWFRSGFVVVFCGFVVVLCCFVLVFVFRRPPKLFRPSNKCIVRAFYDANTVLSKSHKKTHTPRLQVTHTQDPHNVPCALDAIGTVVHGCRCDVLSPLARFSQVGRSSQGRAQKPDPSVKRQRPPTHSMATTTEQTTTARRTRQTHVVAHTGTTTGMTRRTRTKTKTHTRASLRISNAAGANNFEVCAKRRARLIHKY